MTDYQPLIARAVEGLGKSTGEARRGLYERARSALVTQLRSVEPPLSESDITRERLSLEEAIRRVEADAARRTRMESRTGEVRFEPRPLRPTLRTTPPAPPPSPPPAPPRQERFSPEPDDEPPHDEPPQIMADDQAAAVPPAAAKRPETITARKRLLSARAVSITREGLRGFRDVVNEVDDLGSASAKAAQTARDTRDNYEPLPRRQTGEIKQQPLREQRFEPLDDDQLRDYDALQPESLEPSYQLEDDEPPLFPSQSGRPRPPSDDDEYESTRPPRSYAGLAKLAVIACAIGIVVAVLAWQWPNISQFASRFGSHAPTATTQQDQQP